MVSEDNRLSRVADVCADLGSVVLVEEDEGLRKLAQAYLSLLPVQEVHATLHGRRGSRTCRLPAAGAEKRSPTGGTHTRTAAVMELRCRDKVFGEVEVLSAQESPLLESDLRLGQHLADLAAACFHQRHLLEDARSQVQGLQQELNETIVLEQAKGMLAGFTGSPPQHALALLRAQATSAGKPLHALAAEIVDGAHVSRGRPAPSWPDWLLRHRADTTGRASAEPSKRPVERRDRGTRSQE